jgi:hypothetical protein
MLNNYEKSLKATEERIRNSNITEANKQFIFTFESNCFAEGLKIARVLKHLIELAHFLHISTSASGKEVYSAIDKSEKAKADRPIHRIV